MKQLLFKPIFVFIIIILHATSSYANNPEKEHTVIVVGEDKEPLVGVNIYSSDHQFSTSTDAFGKAKLNNLKFYQEIHFSYTGYQLLRIPLIKIKEKGWKITLIPDSKLLETIVVVGRRNESSDEISNQIQTFSQQELAFSNASTAADALDKLTDVFVQKSQMGGGSPIIRGFEANRVLLVMDGVRLNNAIYRNGHLQNAITVDNAILEQVEVIYGPGSLMYGSDALGGVVHFRSKDPQLFFPLEENGKNYQLNGNFYTRYGTANQEKSIHADFNFGQEKWGFLTSFTYTDYNDLRAGSNRPKGYPDFGKRLYYVDQMDGKDVIFENDDPNLQRQTAYSQMDFLQKFRFQPSEKLYFVANLQFSTSSDIPRYDRLTETTGGPGQLKFAEWYYGPQTRALASLKTKWIEPTKWFDEATIIGAFQFIEEDRHDRRTGRTIRESSLVDVMVYSITVDFDKNLDEKQRHQLAYGLGVSHNDVIANAFSTNIIDGARFENIATRYPSGGSQLTSFGSYLNYRWKSLDSTMVLNAGLRYNFTSLFAKFSENDPIQWPTVYTEGLPAQNDALTWALGLTYNMPGQWQFRVLAATAFRSPNIDDFAKFREKGGYVTIPNPELGPENSLTTELTLAKTIGNIHETGLKISATGFYTRLKNAIVRENFYLPGGNTYFLSHKDTMFVQANVNADNAYIYGFSSNLMVNLDKRWQLKSSLNFTWGERSYIERDDEGEIVVDMLVPQDHIPPVYGHTSLSYHVKKFNIEASVRYNGWKRPDDYAVSSVTIIPDAETQLDRSGTADNIEQGLIESETGAFKGLSSWTTFNLYASYQLLKNFTLNLSLENITDVHYRPFASGVSAPGRNLIIAFRGNF